MPKALQAKLLRALESGEVRRIGENETRHVDVRFLAATNLDIQAAMERGDFRSDLFYRLNVHRIHLPPLRERGDDVRDLIQHFITRFGGATRDRYDARGRRALGAYQYPGNVRQLQHIVQRAVTVARGELLDVDDLPEEVVATRVQATAQEGSVAAARERAEREMIVATLARNNGEVSAAAREMQVSRTTMWRLMKKHGISA